jgi:LuxR family maltose regulon positive regulatory protein
VSSADLIAATKLHIPAPRPGLVARPSLLARLSSDGGPRLTLLVAPPGYGKTTLLAQWHASPTERRAFAWLSLDPDDNDPVRFWSSAIAALRTVAPGAGERALGALRIAGVGLTDLVLPLLVNELTELRSPLVLVLDDYHLVHDRRIHESVAFALDHLPAGVQVAIATRSEPPLPLGRLRARAEITELRATDLRLDDDEAAALLASTLGRRLESADASRLAARTEGWAAGLQLAALSLRGREDRHAFVESFAGDDRHIADYLIPEVLDGQPDDVRAFLLRTSVLDRLCGPLCDAVLEAEGGTRMLERIERSSLFLLPLDTRRVWYRYHALFAELLRRELDLFEPGLGPLLHRRASAWHRLHGSIPEGIHHALAGGLRDEARDLIARHWNAEFNQGRLDTVAGWLGALPHERVASDPRLCVASAWLAMDRGRLEETDRWITLAEEAGARSDADVAVLRAVHSFKIGSLSRARLAAQQALEPAAPPTFPLTVAHLISGIATYWEGRPSEAMPALERAATLARESGNDLATSYALGYQALIHSDRGSVDEAERLADAAAAVSADPGCTEHFVAMVAHLAHGRAAARRGDRRRAEQATRRALQLARRGAGALELAAALLALAGAERGTDRGEAAALEREARALLARCPDPGPLAAGYRGAAPRPRSVAEGDELTERELAVLRMLAGDLSLRQIGAELYVSLNTVKTHTRGIYRKLRAASRADAVARARAAGLI